MFDPGELTHDAVDYLEKWWIQKAFVNFLAFRIYINDGKIKTGWFFNELSRILQEFYIEYINHKRPLYLINTPPQHGKSKAVVELFAWMMGRHPWLRIIYASFADRLGKRANTELTRIMMSNKYRKIFPDVAIKDSRIIGHRFKLSKTDRYIEVAERHSRVIGSFRNTTVDGQLTGESLDIGAIDDPVKGRKESKSIVVSQKIWEWYLDDFDTRLDEYAGILGIMTRWTTHDLTARILENDENAKHFNFQAIATKDERFRSSGEALFPELKSLIFLLKRKKIRTAESWESLYQGNPIVSGGNMIKSTWFRWWRTKSKPVIKYYFITIDSAQKKTNRNDYTVFQCWGFGYDNNIYLLEKKRERMSAPELRINAELFYKKWDVKKKNVRDPVLRAMYIEDKSSGIGLIQELKKKKLKIVPVPRSSDKDIRVNDAAPYIQAGFVWLNTDIDDVQNLVSEAEQYPDGEFDDDLDTMLTAVEVTYINDMSFDYLMEALKDD